MIQGFCTRWVTDQIVKPFVKSADGIIHEYRKEVDMLSKATWLSFKEENLKKYPIVVFGILRGTGDLIKDCEKIKQTYYHIDHAYYFKALEHEINPIFNDKIYRITKNDLMINYIDQLNENDYERIKRYKGFYKIKPWKKTGDYIIVFPPSDHVKKWYNISNWETETIEKLKTITKRKIIIKNKNDNRSFKQIISNAWAVVTCQSTAAVDALLEGVPSFCDEMSMAKPVSCTDLSLIETPFYPDNREEWFDSLLANQYFINEIRDGIAWNRLKNK